MDNNKSEKNDAKMSNIEVIIMNVSICIGFLLFLAQLYLYSKDMVPFYMFFVYVAIPIVPLIIITIKQLIVNNKDNNNERD